MRTSPNNLKGRSVALASIIIATLGSTTAIAADEEDLARNERTCIHVASINGFSPIDKRHLTVSVGANKVYLVTLTNTCRELKWNEEIAIKASGPWTCSNSHDKIFVGYQKCYISNIRKVESREKAKEIVLGQDRD